jgi:hypothetical protein
MQDVFVFYQLGRLKDGVYLDIGCGYAKDISNTYALEELGWRGLGIDFDHNRIINHREQRKNPVLEADALGIDWLQVQKDYKIGPVVDYLSFDLDDSQGEPSKILIVLRNLMAAGFIFRVATIEHDAYRLGSIVKDGIEELMKVDYHNITPQTISIIMVQESWWLRK